VGIGSEKSVLNRILGVSCIAQDAVGPSVQRRQATSQNLLQLLSYPFFIWNSLALLNPDVCIDALHAVFLDAAKFFATCVSIAFSSRT
jgi:hypothetical protein